MEVIHAYTWQEAVNEQQLFRLWLDDGNLPTNKPVLATIGIWTELEDMERLKIMNCYLDWLAYVCPYLSEDDRLFATKDSKGNTVWVVDDGATITMLYPHEH